MKYKLTLAFDGNAFSGWQMQKNAPTVQAEMTRVARLVLGNTATVTGSSRTDSGVHAKGYVCHIDTEKTIQCHSVVDAFNHNLDPHIAVLDCKAVEDEFHARYSAHSKEYRYFIKNSRIPDPFLNSRAWLYGGSLDVEKMKSAAREFTGVHDFKAFMATGSKIEDTVREVYLSEIENNGDTIVFRVRANGFLYNMVRIMVGTLVDIARGKIDMCVTDIINSKERSRAGVTAPSCGLYLWSVEY